MLDAGAKRDTISKSHQLLGSVMKAAVERRLISVNPMPPLLLPKQDQKQHAYLSLTQVSELLDAVPAHHRALIAVLAYTGIRFGEAAALERRSIDLTRGRIHVVRSVGEVKGVLTYGPPKNGKKRTVPMPKALFSMIEPMLEDGPLDGNLFSTSTGFVLRLGTWRTRVFNKALKSINSRRLAEGRPEFPAITPHDLRHTAASLAVQSGANVKVVQRMLGHASAAITLDVYADLFDSDLDEVATRMDELIRRED